MKCVIILCTLCACFAVNVASLSQECETENTRYCKDTEDFEPSGYIFTSPRSLKLGTSNEVHFQRFGNLHSGSLNVQVTCKKNYDYPEDIMAANQKFFFKEGQSDVILYLPVKKIDGYVYDGKLIIDGTFGRNKISGNDTINLSTPQTSIIIIQTDKPMYQPGQTVKFRILRLNKELKPFKKDYKAEAFVEDAKGTRLFQFDDIDLRKGIIQREFLLADEPVKGSWTIKVSTNSTTVTASFDVKQYVLPKFDVNINFPSFVLANSEYIPIQICAKYTYGKPLMGTLNLNVSLQNYYYSTDKYPTLQESVEIDGCYNYSVNVSLIEPNNTYTYRSIEVVANVVEDGTGVEKTVTQSINRQTSPLNLQFIDQRQYYKSGLPFNGKLKVSNPDNTPAPYEPVEICATVTKQRVLASWWATRKFKLCKKYKSNKKGIINFTVFSRNVDDVSIELNAKSTKYVDKNTGVRQTSLSQPQTSTQLNPFYSPSGSFVQIQPVHQPVPCETKTKFQILFTSKKDADFKFYYQVMKQADVVLVDTVETSFSTDDDDVSSSYDSGDRIINGKEQQLVPPPQSTAKLTSAEKDCPAADDEKYSPPIGEVDIEIDVDTSLSPVFYLLVYYVRDDRETVADSVKIEVEKCFKNKVDFAFGDKAQQPGLQTSIKITAAPNSLCGIKAIDKSLLLLDSRDQLTKDNVFQNLNSMDINQYYTNNPCYQNKLQPGLEKSAYKMIIRPPPPGSSSTYEDTLTSFQTSGLLVISDLFIFTRPCNPEGNGGGYLYGNGGIRPMSKGFSASMKSVQRESADTSSTVSVKEVRDYFPETWLFEMEMTGPDGTFVTNKQLPDTITEWIGSAVCLSSEDGLGISNTTGITALQAFFIDYTLPVSVIRGEEFFLIVTIFNYADGALPITVSLSDSEGFEVTSDSIDGNYCIKRDTSISLNITLRATKVGKVNITVLAESAGSNDVCGDSDVSNSYARDAITKPIEVEPEGFPNENVTNLLFCPSDNEKNHEYDNTITLSVPKDVIPDSSRAYMDFTGNVMGPAINNLNNLVSLPTGCGEQNMVKFTPNTIVLDYLSSIKMLTDEIESRAIRNLVTGYQRELAYRHYDGSFSAFGEVDKQGSMFLTAFVLRSFYQAKRYIYIDDNILHTMQDWILGRQNADGCFQNVGQIIDIGLEGGLTSDKSSGSITAYVLTSLLISGFKNETIIDAAFSCLEKNPPSNPYSALVYAYAEALGGRIDDAQKHIDEARQRINKIDGMESFIIVNGTEAIIIEANSYAVLATLAVGGTASETLSYVRYLATHLNPNGGFQSTQDTCVGLDALAQFAKLIYKEPLNLAIETSGGLKKVIEVTDKNKLLVQRFKVSDVPSKVEVEAQGTGCGLIQASIRYNTKTPPEKRMFSLSVKGECSFSSCKHATITVLVSYLPSDQKSGMSIVEIKLITGFVADKGSLDQLKSNESNNILRIDVQNNMVIFYFSEISNKVQDFSFQIEQIVDVRNAQPGIAKVSDYYANEHSTSTSYTIKGFN